MPARTSDLVRTALTLIAISTILLTASPSSGAQSGDSREAAATKAAQVG